MVRDFGQINLTDSRLPPPSKAIRHEFDVAVAQPEIALQVTKFIAGALLDRGFVFGTHGLRGLPVELDLDSGN